MLYSGRKQGIPFWKVDTHTGNLFSLYPYFTSPSIFKYNVLPDTITLAICMHGYLVRTYWPVQGQVGWPKQTNLLMYLMKWVHPYSISFGFYLVYKANDFLWVLEIQFYWTQPSLTWLFLVSSIDFIFILWVWTKSTIYWFF